MKDKEQNGNENEQQPEEIKGSEEIRGSGEEQPVPEGEAGVKNVSEKPGFKKVRTALIIVAAVLVLLILGIAAYGLAFFNQVQETQRVLLNDSPAEAAGQDEAYLVDEYFPDHIVNIGLLGFDRGWNREEYGEYLFRPDMLAVLSIDFDQDTIAVVRIPRDSYVPIHGTGGFHDKINHSYYYGYRSGNSDDAHADGIRNTLLTVSNVLGGIPIHYYISVDMYSIIELVDAVGGIYYESEQEIIDKHWEVGRVLVPEGPQVMDGKTYLRYLQYRDDATNQDYGRIDRQMNLLKATYIHLREQGKITDLPAVYRIYKDYVETDLTYKQIAALAYYAAEFEMNEDNPAFYTVEGDGQMKDGIWYQVLFQNRRVAIIKEVFGIEAQPWPPIVLVDSPEYLEEQERKRWEEKFGVEADDDFTLPRPGDEQEAEEDPEERKPQAWIMIPDLRGKTVAEARSILEANGLVIGDIREQEYTLLEPGLVIYCEPLPGVTVSPGTVVSLIISREAGDEGL